MSSFLYENIPQHHTRLLPYYLALPEPLRTNITRVYYGKQGPRWTPRMFCTPPFCYGYYNIVAVVLFIRHPLPRPLGRPGQCSPVLALLVLVLVSVPFLFLFLGVALAFGLVLPYLPRL